MKLLKKISRYYIINSVIFLTIALVSAYLSLSWILQTEIDEKLLVTHNELLSKIKHGAVVDNPPFVELTQVMNLQSKNITFTDTLIFMPEENELEPFRQSTSYFRINDVNYRLILRTSLIENEDLILSLSISFLAVLFLMSVVLYWVNRKAIVKIFRPFYNNLIKVKNYSIKTDEGLTLHNSDIDEFKELNIALVNLSHKASLEYKALKEFSEDLSHELQTPVTVIKNKLELLLQKESNDDETRGSIRTAYQNINKLDKLNSSLILLSKLESIDFFDAKEIAPRHVIEKLLDNYKEAAELKNIEIDAKLSEGETIKCNETLIEILLSNLISNAIRHNYANGKIYVEFYGNTFTIKNTSNHSGLVKEEIFGRFNKKSRAAGTVGLGMAIAKKIADVYNFTLFYSYEEDMHCLRLEMRSNSSV